MDSVQQQALAELANSNAQKQVKVAADGEIEAIVSGMRENAGSAGVLRHGFKALLSIVGNDENKAKIAKEGGADVINAAVQKHPELSELGTTLLLQLGMFGKAA